MHEDELAELLLKSLSCGDSFRRFGAEVIVFIQAMFEPFLQKVIQPPFVIHDLKTQAGVLIYLGDGGASMVADHFGQLQVQIKPYRDRRLQKFLQIFLEAVA